MRQKIKKTGKRSAALALCGALSLSFLAGGIASAVGGKYQAFASTADTITINTGMKYQTLDGWGSTLAWWANEIGDWTKPSAVGTTQREYIMELLYGKDLTGTSPVTISAAETIPRIRTCPTRAICRVSRGQGKRPKRKKPTPITLTRATLFPTSSIASRIRAA